MAVALNSVTSFNPTTNYHSATRRNSGAISLKVPSFTSPSGAPGLILTTERTRSRFHPLASGGENIATETTAKDNKPIEGSYSDNGSSPNIPNINSSAPVEKASTESVDSTNANLEKSNSTVKRATLTAREKLRAARVLSRYNESKDSKPSKPELGSKLLEALQESEKGKKRPGLPQAPTDLLDDSQRGLSKGGWSIMLPGGMDVFFIVFSFVFISSVMFATTYLVWKVGAIHFNEY